MRAKPGSTHADPRQLFISLLALGLAGGCGGATSRADDGAGQPGAAGAVVEGSGGATASDQLVPVTLVSDGGACAGQQAEVPASGEIYERLSATAAEIQRTANSDYVSYSGALGETFVYFSFAPTLPNSPATEVAQRSLDYAYVEYSLEQRRELGGSLTLLSGTELLGLEDFEQFEVVGDLLTWKLVRASAGHYPKPLSLYDQDPTNDPPAGGMCVSDDIVGMCWCEFSGPSIQVTIEGTLPL